MKFEEISRFSDDCKLSAPSGYPSILSRNHVKKVVLTFDNYTDTKVVDMTKELSGVQNKLFKSPVPHYIWIIDKRFPFRFGNSLHYLMVKKAVNQTAQRENVLIGNKIEGGVHVMSALESFATEKGYVFPEVLYMPPNFLSSMGEKQRASTLFILEAGSIGKVITIYSDSTNMVELKEYKQGQFLRKDS